MDIKQLLKESFQPEQAALIESAIAQVIDAKVEEKLQEAKADAATQQAQVAQKSAEELENISQKYDAEMKKAAKAVVELEKFYNREMNIAVDKIVTAYDDAERQAQHYESELKEAAEMFIAETEHGSLSEAQEQIAKYVQEHAKLIDQAQEYGEYAFQEGLAEAQTLVEEATQKFIQENQEKFDRLDEMARYEKIVNSIKEAYEHNALGLSEDEAYKGLQEEVEQKETVISQLQESLDQTKQQLFESQKEAAFDRLTKNLSESQKEKLKDVSGAIIAEDVESYSRTLHFLVESQSTKEKPLTESEKFEKSHSQQVITESKSSHQSDDYVNSLISKMI